MALKIPDSMDECLYFTNRSLENEGRAIAWVYRPLCPKCGKGRMGKPINKRGKPDKKAPIFECPQCHHQLPNEEVDKIVQVEVDYKCPKCGNESQAATEYKRKSFQGVPAFVFECGKCSEKIGITKKLKEAKKKKVKEEAGDAE